MKAILLAGGKGTRLRPLTVHTPKPIVPIFNRPFLHYQIDLLQAGAGDRRSHPQPELPAAADRGDLRRRRTASASRIRYVVEPMPLGTGGAVRYAGDSLHGLGGRVQRRRADAGRPRRPCCGCTASARRKATIVLTPVENPRAYGLVETDARRQHPALSREAGRGRDHLQHDQRRHLRARAGHVRSHPEGHAPGRSSAASSRR